MLIIVTNTFMKDLFCLRTAVSYIHLVNVILSSMVIQLIFGFQMGICKANEQLFAKFPWALAIQGDENRIKCRYAGKVLSVEKGSGALEQHEERPVHTNAVGATGEYGIVWHYLARY